MMNDEIILTISDISDLLDNIANKIFKGIYIFDRDEYGKIIIKKDNKIIFKFDRYGPDNISTIYICENEKQISRISSQNDDDISLKIYNHINSAVKKYRKEKIINSLYRLLK